MEHLELNPTDLGRLGIEVPLNRVDKALKDVWAGDDTKTRASLINFAIYTESARDLASNMEQLEAITAEHACRAILILNLPHQQQAPAKAYINAICRPYQGKQIVCSEQIVFILQGASPQTVQNVVFAHLDSDLPLIVWWQSTLTRNLDERLFSRITTLIVDSARWQQPAAEFTALNTALSTDTADFDVRDLSWTRSHFMRTALANCFRDPRALSQLHSVHSVHIEHTASGHIAALLLGTWIATRILTAGGKNTAPIKALPLPPSDGSATFRFSTDTQPEHTIEVRLSPSSHCPALKSLELLADSLRVHIDRPQGSRFVHLNAQHHGCGKEELYPADLDSETDLISEQLSRAGGRSLYGNMVPLIHTLLTDQPTTHPA